MQLRLSPLKKLVPLLLGILIFTSCNVFQRIRNEVSSGGKPKQFTSKDGTYQLTIPGNWREDPELHDTATLEASNRFQEMYVIVIKETKGEFGVDLNLEEYTNIIRNGLIENVHSPVASDPQLIMINGRTAREFELKGYADNINVAYLIATVETDNAFHQIITWTLNSYFDKNKDILRRVVQSFKSTDMTIDKPTKTTNSKTIEERLKEYKP
jgi:hypothetical protein